MAGCDSSSTAPDGAQSTAHILLGLLCATISASSGGLGDNLVRLSYRLAELRKQARDSTSVMEDGQRERRESGVLRVVGPYCPSLAAVLPAELGRPFWILGWSSTTLVNTGFVILAMSLAPSSFIIPFAAVHIFFAVTFARVVNKEPCTITKALGCTCIICGVLVVLVTNGLLPHDEVYGLSRLESDLIETPYLALTGLVLCAIALALGAFATRARHGSKAIAQLSIAVTAGSFGAISNVLGKSVIEIVKTAQCSGEYKALLSDAFVYAILGGMVVALVCQICALNTALSSYETMVVTPLVNGTLTVVGTLESVVYFQEYESWELYTWCLMPLGVCIAALGLLLLAGVVNPCARCDRGSGMGASEGGDDWAAVPRSEQSLGSDVMLELAVIDSDEDSELESGVASS